MNPQVSMPAPETVPPDPPVAIWHRRSRRCKWRVYARGDTALEVLWVMRGAGEWMLIGDPSYDPNETTLADVQRRVPA